MTLAAMFAFGPKRTFGDETIPPGMGPWSNFHERNAGLREFVTVVDYVDHRQRLCLGVGGAISKAITDRDSALKSAIACSRALLNGRACQP